MSDPSEKASAPSLWPIAVAIMFISIVVALFLWTPFKTKISNSTAILSFVERARSEAKLVVYTFDVRAEIVEQNSKEFPLGWGDHTFPLGTTTVTLRSSGNRVQAVVPLASISANWFSVNQATKTIILHIPKPIIDAEFVSVQTDPRFVELKTDLGWARLDSRSGEHLRDVAKQKLRSEVINEGKRRLALDYQEEANRGAEKILQKLFEPLKSQMEEGASLVVKFE